MAISCYDDDGNLVIYQSTDNPEDTSASVYGYCDYDGTTYTFTWDPRTDVYTPDQITPPKPVLPPKQPPVLPPPPWHKRIKAPKPCLPPKPPGP